MAAPDKFPLLRTILRTLGLSAEAIDDILDRILEFLSGSKEAPAPNELTFGLRDDFLSPAEQSFHGVLRGVTGGDAVICPKVALGDIFFAKSGDARQNRILTNRIDRKHVDFLLCDPITMRPIAGIELDDRSHERPDRRQRDQLVEAVFAAAGLPLIRVPVQRSYAPSEIIGLVRPHFRPQPTPAAVPTQPVIPATAALPGANSPKDHAPACPKCGATMVRRTAKSGANSGGQFWGCPNFPRCRSMQPIA